MNKVKLFLDRFKPTFNNNKTNYIGFTFTSSNRPSLSGERQTPLIYILKKSDKQSILVSL